jgi:hypothetical protein
VKVFVFFILLIQCATPNAFGQYAWFKQFSGNGYVVGTNLSISNDDAIYSVGNFENNVSVFGHTFAGSGSFIVKVTTHGELIWVHQIVNSGSNDGLIKIRSDGVGNIYVVGTCNQNVTIGGQSIPGAKNTSYVAKLNEEGDLQWFQIVPVQNIFEIDVNKQGDLVLIGRLLGSITLGENFLSCSECSFGASLTTTGTYHWAKIFFLVVNAALVHHSLLQARIIGRKLSGINPFLFLLLLMTMAILTSMETFGTIFH